MVFTRLYFISLFYPILKFVYQLLPQLLSFLFLPFFFPLSLSPHLFLSLYANKLIRIYIETGSDQLID